MGLTGDTQEDYYKYHRGPEGGERDKRRENFFEEIMGENFSNLGEETNYIK